MSTESRLARLGLLHLKDKPEELEKALAERTKQREAEEKEWQEEKKKIRKAYEERPETDED